MAHLSVTWNRFTSKDIGVLTDYDIDLSFIFSGQLHVQVDIGLFTVLILACFMVLILAHLFLSPLFSYM